MSRNSKRTIWDFSGFQKNISTIELALACSALHLRSGGPTRGISRAGDHVSRSLSVVLSGQCGHEHLIFLLSVYAQRVCSAA